MLKGRYGRTPMPVDPVVLAKIDGSERISCRPADLLEPELAKFEEEIGEYREQDEDVLTYALFGQVALEYFRRRAAIRNGVDPDAIDMKNKSYPA